MLCNITDRLNKVIVLNDTSGRTTVFWQHGKHYIYCNGSLDDAQNDVSSNFGAVSDSP